MPARQMTPQFPNCEKRERLREIIRTNSLLKGREFRLSSGGQSSYYFEMRPTTLDPEGANLVADLILEEIAGDDARFIGGLAMGAIPIVTAVTVRSWPVRPIKGFYVRDEVKEHGTKGLIYGSLDAGSEVILVDDVTTEGKSVMKAVAAVKGRDCRIGKVISVVDRLEGAAAKFREEGIPFIALFTTRDFD